MVVAPPFFGNIELGAVPAEEEERLIGRVVEATLYDITSDFSHMYLKMFFQISEIDGKTARTLFKGHEYSRDYLRSLVRRRTTKVDGLFNLTTKEGYKLRIAVSALTLSRIKTSQEKIIRTHHGENHQRKSRCADTGPVRPRNGPRKNSLRHLQRSKECGTSQTCGHQKIKTISATSSAATARSQASIKRQKALPKTPNRNYPPF